MQNQVEEEEVEEEDEDEDVVQHEVREGVFSFLNKILHREKGREFRGNCGAMARHTEFD